MKWTKVKKLLGVASILMISSVMSQVLGLFIVFYLNSELLSVAEFGEYAMFMSVCSIASSSSIFSLEKAIPNKRKEELGTFILELFCIITGFSVILYIILYFINYNYTTFTLARVYAMGALIVLNHLNIRSRQMHLLAMNQLLPNALFCLVVFQFGGSDFESNVSYTIWFQTLATTLSFVIMGIVTLNKTELTFIYKNLFKNKFLVENKSFLGPFFISKFFNTAARESPVIIIGKFFDTYYGGQYAMTMRMGMAPVTLIGRAVSQIYHGKLAEKFRNKKRSRNRVNIVEEIKVLLPFGVFILIISNVILPLLLEIVFVEKYVLSQTYLRILSPLLSAMVIVYPLSSVLYVKKAGKIELISQIAFFVISISSFGLSILTGNLIFGVSLFSILSVLRFGILLIVLNKLN